MSQELVGFVTSSDTEDAARLADTLVSEQLAACVNVVPGIESVYRWEGKITRDIETLLIIKTTDARYAELERRVKELHSYTTPEVVALRIERGSEPYLNWLRASTATPEDPSD